ncbi:nicotinamide mononucleotide transporter [Arthrobacter castelli]|uniref:nicotinamide mononucleotide transporter n=1 Tax=Arthrobacter castelli TaxID=271431 RepID=UPI00040BF265|nr:nicotinamide mononucleotide transporter [Arthrobacter castelli]
MNGLGNDGGTQLVDLASTWLPVLSVALLIVFAALAARRSTWAWLAAGLSVLVTMVPFLVAGPGMAAFGLSPLAFLTLLVPLLGWWIWHRAGTEHTAGALPVRHATGKHYLIAAVILVVPALFSVVSLAPQGALAELSAGQAALAVLGQFMRGMLFVALLGLAFGLVESWWLLVLDSAWYLLPAVLGLNTIDPLNVSVAAHVAMAVLHAGVIIAAVLGYRAWNSRTGTSSMSGAGSVTNRA